MPNFPGESNELGPMGPHLPLQKFFCTLHLWCHLYSFDLWPIFTSPLILNRYLYLWILWVLLAAYLLGNPQRQAKQPGTFNSPSRRLGVLPPSCSFQVQAPPGANGRLTFPKRMSDLRLWSSHVYSCFILFYHFFKLTWLTRYELWLSLPRSPAIDMNAPLVGLPIGCNLQRQIAGGHTL